MYGQMFVSVVIPVFNAEAYIEHTVESILQQTHKNTEIILVDDGSTDNSPVLCDKMSELYKSCKTVHKVNGGASSARNRGIDESTGEWIFFVDSDDSIPNDAVENLLRASDGADYVAGSITANKGKSSYPNQSQNISFASNPYQLLQYLTLPGSYAPYAKLFKRSLIDKHGIRFNENLKCSEDAVFVRQYLLHCDRLNLIPTVVYYYNNANLGSLSKKIYPEFSDYFIEKLKVLSEITKRIDIPEEEKKRFLSERAVHGMKISVAHYLKGEMSESQQKELVFYAVALLRPWISTGELYNKKLSAWWKKHETEIAENDMERFYASIRKEEKRSAILRRAKQIVKNIRGSNE